MFSHFYQKNIIEKPKIIFGILLICLASFGFFIKDFRLDASSETLLIEFSEIISSLGVKVKIRNSLELYLSVISFKYFKSGSPSINNVSEEASNLKSFEKNPKPAKQSSKIVKITFGFSIIFF